MRIPRIIHLLAQILRPVWPSSRSASYNFLFEVFRTESRKTEPRMLLICGSAVKQVRQHISGSIKQVLEIQHESICTKESHQAVPLVPPRAHAYTSARRTPVNRTSPLPNKNARICSRLPASVSSMLMTNPQHPHPNPLQAHLA